MLLTETIHYHRTTQQQQRNNSESKKVSAKLAMIYVQQKKRGEVIGVDGLIKTKCWPANKAGKYPKDFFPTPSSFRQQMFLISCVIETSTVFA